MNSKVYDQQEAGKLVPLLRSITTEIQERSRTIDELEARLDRVSRGVQQAPRSAGAAVLEGQLAQQRRELRLAERELERLGCVLDADHPLRVLIPGADGELDHGFAWSPPDETSQSAAL